MGGQSLFFRDDSFLSGFNLKQEEAPGFADQLNGEIRNGPFLTKHRRSKKWRCSVKFLEFEGCNRLSPLTDGIRIFVRWHFRHGSSLHAKVSDQSAGSES